MPVPTYKYRCYYVASKFISILHISIVLIVGILRKLTSHGRQMPYDSMLTIARDVARIQEGLPGEYSYHVHATRRNSVTKLITDVPTEHKKDGVNNMAGCVKALLASLKHPRAYRPAEDGKCEVFVGGVKGLDE